MSGDDPPLGLSPPWVRDDETEGPFEDAMRALAEIGLRLISRTVQERNPHSDTMINFNYEGPHSFTPHVRAYRRLQWDERDNRWSRHERWENGMLVSELAALVEWLEEEAKRPRIIAPIVSDAIRFLVLPLARGHKHITRILVDFGAVAALDRLAARFPWTDGDFVDDGLQCCFEMLRALQVRVAVDPRQLVYVPPEGSPSDRYGRVFIDSFSDEDLRKGGAVAKLLDGGGLNMMARALEQGAGGRSNGGRGIGGSAGVGEHLSGAERAEALLA